MQRGLVPQGHLKAQYEVLGNGAKRDVRPARDDRKVWLLVCRMRLHQRKAAVDRPVRYRDALLLKHEPSTKVLGFFH